MSDPNPDDDCVPELSAAAVVDDFEVSDEALTEVVAKSAESDESALVSELSESMDERRGEVLERMTDGLSLDGIIRDVDIEAPSDAVDAARESMSVSAETMSHKGIGSARMPVGRSMSFEDEASLRDAMTYTTVDLDVDIDVAQKLLRKIRAKVEKRRSAGYEIDQFVIGVPQYRKLLPYCMMEWDVGPGELLDLEIIVVPGPMMHPVIEPRQLLFEMQDEK